MMSQKRSGAGMGRGALVHERRRAVGERSVDDVGVARDPADVGGAPVDVVVLEVEDRLGGRGDVGEVAAGRVQDALGLAGRAARVEDEERVLGVELRRRAFGLASAIARATRDRGPSASRPAAGALDDDDVLDAGRPLDGLVDRGLQREGRAACGSRRRR